MSRRVAVSPDALPDRDLTGRSLELPDDAAHYVRDVLRKSAGDALEIIDGTGRRLRARLQTLSSRSVRAAVHEDEASELNESPLSLVLFQAIPKGDRWRWVLEKATELGVDRLVPLETKRTVVDIGDDKVESKLARWKRIARSAARQCGRVRIPALRAPLDVGSALQLPEAERPVSFVPHPGTGSPRLSDVTLDTAAERPGVALWIGPEGGWTDGELDALRDGGGRLVALGPRTLRTETAGVCAAAIAQSRWGDG